MTLIPFTPSNKAAFQFQPTLDGQQYTGIVTWNLFGKRFYVNLYQLDGTQVFTLPLIESPAGAVIESLIWDAGIVEAATNDDHGFTVGATVQMTIAGCLPVEYNGDVLAFVTSDTTFTYPVSSDPGVATQFGVASYNISMTAGYFDSTLVFRNGQFEVTP